MQSTCVVEVARYATCSSAALARIGAQTNCCLDLLNGRNREIFLLPATNESSEGLTSDIGRCDVRGVRDRLQQTNTKDLDVS